MQKEQTSYAVRDIKREMSLAAVTSAQAFSMMSPPPKNCRTPNARIGDSVNAFKSQQSIFSKQQTRAANYSSIKPASRKRLCTKELLAVSGDFEASDSKLIRNESKSRQASEQPGAELHNLNDLKFSV